MPYHRITVFIGYWVHNREIDCDEIFIINLYPRFNNERKLH
jgi:hypothetical protein